MRPGALAMALAAAALLAPAAAHAGPPFLTDDPEPVPLHHWELYLASQWDLGTAGATGTLPHFETNYGALPGLQLHLLVPAVLAEDAAGTRYGLGDVELGFKWRLLDETATRPQIGVFPLVLLPTGSAARGLGTGQVQVFVPVWIQKGFGKWLTYGGAAVRLTGPAVDLEAGWLLQRQVTAALALGAEAYLTVPLDGTAARLQVDFGAVADLTAHVHVLASAGPSLGGGAGGQAYLALLVTI